jgi:hypothetical protein
MFFGFQDLPEPIQNALIVLPPEKALSAIQQAAAGLAFAAYGYSRDRNRPVLLRTCRELGLEVISGECILMFAKPSSYHKVHRWVSGLLGKLPA